jgi:hypothetical protein
LYGAGTRVFPARSADGRPNLVARRGAEVYLQRRLTVGLDVPQEALAEAVAQELAEQLQA